MDAQPAIMDAQPAIMDPICHHEYTTCQHACTICRRVCTIILCHCACTTCYLPYATCTTAPCIASVQYGSTCTASVHLTVVLYGLGSVLACTSKYTCLTGYINSHHAMAVMWIISPGQLMLISQ